MEQKFRARTCTSIEKAMAISALCRYPKRNFQTPNDLWETLEDFMRDCNVTYLLLIEKGLFV